MTVLAGVVVLLVGAVSASAVPQDPPPLPSKWTHLFQQEHRDALHWWNHTWLPQTVPSGAVVQIQLPGDPIRWVHDENRKCTPTTPLGLALPILDLFQFVRPEFLGQNKLPDPNRIDGTENIYTFDYRLDGIGVAAICLFPEPRPGTAYEISMPPGTPTDRYVLTLLVGVPQASLPLRRPHEDMGSTPSHDWFGPSRH
ncbi:hypothetical protein GCM10012275_37050 [Longimycelium tulufanense]|uniref:Secreted protein n=1 Tax=Longimycelium tulufanense TaxID=907463 RepID=A0A8J3CDE3_9PSEU|nr:hypothetical protein [Longimycelium tulufanense]GGM62973.1 hypothetical protein GCM10012275_37050 [Longimycelium tulufanense]